MVLYDKYWAVIFPVCLLNSISQSHGGEGAAHRKASFCGEEGWTDSSEALFQNTRRPGCADHPPPGSLLRYGLLLLPWVQREGTWDHRCSSKVLSTKAYFHPTNWSCYGTFDTELLYFVIHRTFLAHITFKVCPVSKRLVRCKLFAYSAIHWYPTLSTDAGGMLQNGDIEVRFAFDLRDQRLFLCLNQRKEAKMPLK